MKKITLAVIILFITLSAVVFLGSIFIQKNNPKINKTEISKVDFNKYIKNDNTNINKISNQSKEHLNSPNINIQKLTFDLTRPAAGSFTAGEVSKHNFKNDCYLIINNNVYDVSSYISYHPGGSRTITSRCGKEVTGIFARIHSNRAWDLLKNYKIGTIAADKLDTTFQVLTAISNALKKANPNAEILKVRPKDGFYVAKIIYNGKLSEIHINNNGQITKEEIEYDEPDWVLWANDKDDK